MENSILNHGGGIPLSESDDIPIMPSLDISGIKSADLYRSFELHFPNEAERWNKFRKGVCGHNVTCASFTERLKELIGKMGKLPFTSPASGHGVDEDVPNQMRTTLYQLAEQQEYHNRYLIYDFTKVKLEFEDGKEHVKLVYEGYKARKPVVIASGWDEAERYQVCLEKLQKSPELREEALQLYNSAKNLEKEKEDFTKHLNSICDQYSKYGAELKRQNGCSICQVIFGKQ